MGFALESLAVLQKHLGRTQSESPQTESYSREVLRDVEFLKNI